MNLEVKHLCAGYRNHLVINDLNMIIPSGSIAALLGPNGCGKSTLLKTIAGLRTCRSGHILLAEKELRCYTRQERAGVLALLPQLHHAPPDITVEELVAFGRFPHRTNGFFYTTADRDAVNTALLQTDLNALRLRRIRELSGGERQRVWIALALAQEPQILLLDEPTTFLDLHCQLEIMELLCTLNRKLSLTILMVVHDLNLAAAYSDQLLFLKNGTICHAGSPAEVLTAAVVKEIFDVQIELLQRKNGTLYCVPSMTR